MHMVELKLSYIGFKLLLMRPHIPESLHIHVRPCLDVVEFTLIHRH